MKRVAVIAIFMAVMASLFAFPIFGTTYEPTTYNRYTDAYTLNNVTYSLAVTQFKALSTGTSMLPGGMETIMLVTFQINNRNDQAALCSIPQFTIDLKDERVITDVFTYGGDFVLALNSNSFVIYPTEEFSYSQTNSIIVPPNKSLTLVGGIGLPAQLDQTGQSTLDTGLRGVHLYNKPYTVTLGDYNYGSPIDLSPVLTYIDGIESDLSTLHSDNVNILNRIIQLVNLFSYSGNYYQFSPSIPSVSTANTTNHQNQTGLSIIAKRNVGSSYLVTIDNVVDYDNDTQIVNGTVRYPFYFTMRISNTGLPIRSSSQYLATNIVPTNNMNGNVVIDYFDSNLFSSIDVVNNNNLGLFNDKFLDLDNCSYSYLPYGTFDVFIVGHIDVDINTSITWNSINFDNFLRGTISRRDIYMPSSEYSILRDLYLAYSQVNGLDDIDDAAEDITDKSESAHTQEQSYFTQNAQAIQQTGLSNYRFNGDQENGIGSVSHDFTLLWNALGGFNSVYIFSLTLSLALMILRHAPGAIKSSRRNKEE